MTEIDEGTQNGYTARLIRTINKKQVELLEYQECHDAYQAIAPSPHDDYVRIHSLLGYVTPTEYESQWSAQQQLAHALINQGTAFLGVTWGSSTLRPLKMSMCAVT